MTQEKYETLLLKIIQYASPTLDGVKASSLVNLKDASEKYHTLWQLYKEDVKKAGITFIELKVTEESSLVLIYDETLLSQVLACQKNQDFLSHFAYTDFSIQASLQTLKKRFKNSCPHEVGIFLGYPLGDVSCFADCNKKECLAVGYWKVYENLDQALLTFQRYDSIKKRYLSFIEKGFLPSEAIFYSKELI